MCPACSAQSAVWQHTGGGLKFDRDLCVRADGQRQDSGVRASPGPGLRVEDHDEASCARRRAHRRPGVPGGAGVRALPGGRPESRGRSRVRAETRRRRRRGDRFDASDQLDAHDQLDVLVTLRVASSHTCAKPRRTSPWPGFSTWSPTRQGLHPAAVVPELDAAGGGRPPARGGRGTAVGELGASRRRLKKILISATLTRTPRDSPGCSFTRRACSPPRRTPRRLLPSARGTSCPRGWSRRWCPAGPGDAKPLRCARCCERRTRP